MVLLLDALKASLACPAQGSQQHVRRAPARPVLASASHVVAARSHQVITSPRWLKPTQQSRVSRRDMSCKYSAAPSGSPSLLPVGVAEQVEELLLPLPRASESPVDDPMLHNPLLRSQMLSTAWFGVILEWEGVLTQSSEEEHVQAWLQTATEFGYKRPFGQQLRRIKGVRDEVIVSRVFGWTHNPTIARQVAQRKAEIFEQLLGGRQPAAMLEARPFLDMLKRNGIPVALATPLPDSKVEEGLMRLNLKNFFDAVVTADDSGSAEVEFYYAYAAQKIARPPLRCVVIGESNCSVEAARELGMKVAVVTGNNPVYDFGSADLVVRNLSQLTFMNLKKLFGQENLVEPKSPDEAALGQSGYSLSSDDSFGAMPRFDDDDDDLDNDYYDNDKFL